MADPVTKDNYPVKGVQGFVARPLSERFWRYVVKTDGCWIWIGATASFGYGRIQREGGKQGKADRAHRVSWLLHYGEIPLGMWVLHQCDEPSCVRPDHLFLGTHTDNMLDMAAKGRSTKRAVCKRGHVRTPENVAPDRDCKRCRHDRDVARRALRSAWRGARA